MSSSGSIALEAFPWPSLDRIESCRNLVVQYAGSQGSARLRQALLNALERLYQVDVQAVRLLDGVSGELRGVDIEEYRRALATLDKEGRTESENRAFLHFQQQVAEELQSGMQAARKYVEALEKSLSALMQAFIPDTGKQMQRIEALLAGVTQDEARRRSLELGLQDLKGASLVAEARRGYVHEIEKLVFAMYAFFDSVLEASPQVIQRADDFQRHASGLVNDLQALRSRWKS